MGETFAEYRDVTVMDPLRQGDVIESVDPSASMWKRHLLVLTADCDFANAKHQGRVTCVPILSQDEYLLEFQIPRLRERAIVKAVGELQVALKKAGHSMISDARVREWPMEQTPDEIVSVLEIDDAHIPDVKLLLAAVRTASDAPVDLDSAVEGLIDAQSGLPGGRKREAVQRDVTAALTSHYANPPGDVLFLTAVARTLEDGYFVYLRHLEQVPETEIAIGPTRNYTSYRRVARLRDRFIHAAAQKFAMVFMSIGLPPEYEELRKLHSNILAERYQ